MEQIITDDIIRACIQKISDTAERDPDASLICAKIAGLMVGYHHRWRDQQWRTVEKEQEFQLPIINPETSRRSRTHTYAGKTDGLIEGYAKLVGLEHKTASEDISDPASPYWSRLIIDSQVSHYALANWQQGRKIDGTLYDVIRKPTINPKKIAKADARLKCKDKETGQMREITEEERTAANYGTIGEIESQGTYFGFGELHLGYPPVGETESDELYFLRLARDTINNPDKYFARRMIHRLDNDIVEYATELWEMNKDIASARRLNRHYRNSGSCMQWNTPCEYLGICSGYDTPDSDKWVQGKRHDELNSIGDDSLTVLTNSRMKCFQTCRRKHYFRYEIGLRRADEQQKEALYFGSVFHDVLETWWILKGDSNGTSISSDPVDESSVAVG